MEVTGDTALWQAVYDSPDDDAPRHVLADYLQECGDPRGELIALQLYRSTSQVGPDVTGRVTGRLTALVRKWGEGWLGQLGPLARHATIERGFLQSITLTYVSRSRNWLEIFADPSFGTVEKIDVSYQPELFAMLMASPASRNLRELTIHSEEFWHILEANPPPRLAQLICTTYEAGFVNHVLPFVERSPGITTLGFDRWMLSHLSPRLRERLTGIICQVNFDDAVRLWDDLPTLRSLMASQPFPNYVINRLELVRTENQEFVRIEKDAIGYGVTHKETTALLLQLPQRFRVIELIDNRPLAKWIRAHHGKRFTIISQPTLYRHVTLQD